MHLAFFWTAALWTLATVGAEEPVEEQRLTLCGRNLANARMLVCYEQLSAGKRAWSPPAPSIDAYNFYGYGGGAGYDSWPWLQSRHSALSPRMRVKREGLVEECCYKSCTVSELRTYCE